MKKYIILFTLLLIAQLASAGQRIQDSGWESPMNRIWNYGDQTKATEGEFLKAIDGKVLIDAGDSIVLINIHELHWEDRKYIEERSKKEMGLNELNARHTENFVSNTNDTHYQAKTEFSGFSQWISIFMFLLTCLMLITLYRRRLKEQ